MEIPAPVVQIEMRGEQSRVRADSLTCQGAPAQVTPAQYDAMVAALRDFLRQPDATIGQPDWAQPYLQPLPVLGPDAPKIYAIGPWHLTCLSPGSFAWTQRPARTHMYMAGLHWDDETAGYVIRRLRLTRLQRRTR